MKNTKPKDNYIIQNLSEYCKENRYGEYFVFQDKVYIRFFEGTHILGYDLEIKQTSVGKNDVLLIKQNTFGDI